VYIWNLAGMSRSLWKKWEAKCVKDFCGDWDHHASVAFPEQEHRLCAVNVPSWLLILWRVIKTVVPVRTQKKLSVVGTTGVTETLFRICEIPSSALPKTLGGCKVITLNSLARTSVLKSETVEVPAGTKRIIKIDVSSHRLVYWGVHVQGGKDITVTVKQNEVNVSQQSKPSRYDEFSRGVWHTPETIPDANLTICLESRNVIFSRYVEYVIALFSDDDAVSCNLQLIQN